MEDNTVSVSPTGTLAEAGTIELPSVVQVLSGLKTFPPYFQTENARSLSLEEQKDTLSSLLGHLEKVESGGNLNLSELQASLEGTDAIPKQDSRALESLEQIKALLETLRGCKSRYLVEAAEALANTSRDPSYRILYGQSGLLQFFLQLIASKEHVENEVLLHSLRLVGNSCADTDSNREIVVKSEYTVAIVRHLLNSELIRVAIPVIYNICMDYEPAQSQVAANQIAYILSKLINDGAVKGAALLTFAYELIEFAAEQDESSSEEVQALAQVRLKMNQALAELSSSTLFSRFYPLGSPLSQKLRSWLTAGEDQLQVCSSIMLGNMARSDEACRMMVQDMNIHKELIAVLNSNARGVVLHSTLGFLKNLAIAGDNRSYLGDAGVIPAISRLWAYETLPQVQFSAVSLTRQVIISSVENISRLLDSPSSPPSTDSDSSNDSKTYLSLLLALFEKTDSTPIKTEIGRTVASICRTIATPAVIEENIEIKGLFHRFFSLHNEIARPIGSMITQTQWPVVRSEGLFALALMASSNSGSLAVLDCLQNSEVLQLIKDTLSAEASTSQEENNEDQVKKDRDNVIILVKELSNLNLAENGDGGEETGEMQMLKVSQREVQKTLTEDAPGKSLFVFWYCYIYDPIATGLRFVRLVIIFMPVILAVPLVWMGRRINSGNGTRSGTIWWYGFLVRAMERAGPAFIKLGQWAASRTDIFAPELCAIMSSLHSNAPAHPLHATKETIRKAFNDLPFEEIFEEFDEEPLGVGAIAQVYKAKLKPSLTSSYDQDILHQPESLTGKVRKNVDVLVKSSPHRVPSSYVAVKVLHPRVDRVIRRDLRIMGFFASLINALPTMHWLSLPDEVHQFGEMMKLQLDLRIEAANLVVFREKFKSRTTAWFPYPYMDYTTREVLVEEFAQGIPLSTFLDVGGGVYQEEIANEGLDAFLHMLLIDNFVHADLHPGNIMVRFYKPSELDLSLRKDTRASEAPTRAELDVTEAVLARLRPHSKDPKKWTAALAQLNEEGYRPQLIFIDTGLVTQLNEVNRKNFLDLFRAVAEFDGYKAGHLMVERCRQPDQVVDSEVFALRMQHLVLGVKSRTFALGNIKIGDVLSEVLSMVRSHHVRLEGDFVNVVISILLLEGIGRNLDPDLDLFKSALPILRQLGSSATLLQSVRSGDTSMLRVWVGLEARTFLQASIESVERCVKYDLLSPNI
ncbi:hypothetical protein ASPZODRAFT_151918 [Penicilliopsis zonata CBS 506.65]|uniref:ABC1 atypical kinase-like domain-containing protein n=1 Tax=Penicilliopsis zonata CBS 506.65 TaxID=1073090 RepID=A0A1L9SGP3_9EURO|nr:hypothetical protein ASPZODRAFT_151918 [Penicilliopsis zonata CBS 506.65]OJJ46349.1 hypothetical protein ASPZODRAFT_151918 [Penicilliopsis zonata CBS 506.65]